MKFRFNYEKLLTYYGELESRARRDYFDSLGKLEQEKSVYRDLIGRAESAEDQIASLHEAPAAKDRPAQLQLLDEFLIGQTVRISRQRDVVINHTSIVEQKQEILVSAAKDRRTIEKLKEKKWAEFKKFQAKKEMKRIDELVVTRPRRAEED